MKYDLTDRVEWMMTFFLKFSFHKNSRRVYVANRNRRSITPMAPGKDPMKKEKFKPILLFLLVIVLFMMMISCAHTPGVIGKWREIGKTATLEFSKDGSFKAVDNQGMAVSGKYTLFENGNVRFEIAHPGSSSEIVIGKLSVREDKLTISFKNGHEVERYRRVK